MTIIDADVFMDVLPRLRDGICDKKCRSMTRNSGCDCAIAADEIEKLRGIIRASQSGQVNPFPKGPTQQ